MQKIVEKGKNNMKKQMLENKTVKELLKLPEAKLIKGRYDMKKAELIEALMAHTASEEPKDDSEAATRHPVISIVSRNEKAQYIDNIKIGTIVAFSVNNSKALSGKVEEIHRSVLVVETKNGVKFTVKKSNIIWVKTGERWPRGVYLALKGESDGQDTQIGQRYQRA